MNALDTEDHWNEVSLRLLTGFQVHVAEQLKRYKSSNEENVFDNTSFARCHTASMTPTAKAHHQRALGALRTRASAQFPQCKIRRPGRSAPRRSS